MRAPRWFRDFCAWRWAPSVALIAGALLFIVMVLLLIPQQLGTAARPADAARTPSALGDPLQRVVAVQQPEDSPAAVAPPAPESSAERVVARAPARGEAEGEPTALTPPDYASNIAARADRPTRPSSHSPR